MEEILSYEIISRMEQIRNGQFGPSTCFDYIDSLIKDDNHFGVVIFVEPCGNITKWGPSWEWVLDWWLEVFETQPETADYISAGWYLESLAAENELPDDARKVWDGWVSDTEEGGAGGVWGDV